MFKNGGLGGKKDRESQELLFQEAGMAGHAQPLPLLEHPGIGKATEMLIRPGAASAFRMIDTRNNRGCSVQGYLHVLDIHDARLESRRHEVGTDIPPVPEFA